MLDYQKILNQNMLNVLKVVLKNIKENGLSNQNHLYITFLTNDKNVIIPKWLKDKYPEEMTIIIQYEYYDIKIENDFFEITLSFNDVKTKLKIGYDAVISFADPSANFGLKLKSINLNQKKSKQNLETSNNIINFPTLKKN
tara:strand:+ start:299 stop:721 length:423 start_codon:yes stop_codon:yes gene_type:complete